MRPVRVVAAAVFLGAVAAGESWGPAHGDPSPAAQPTHASSLPARLDALPQACRTGRSSAGEIEALPPTSAEAASQQKWARTPTAAAERTLAAPAFTSLQHLSLQEDVSARDFESSSPTTCRFLAIDADGHVQGILIVSDLGFGAYATTFTDFCA